MAHKRKGQLTVSGEWAKHLRKFFRRQFWKGERKAGKELIRKERQLHVYSFVLFIACLGTEICHAQLKVAQYAHGLYGTEQFEKFEFWTKEGKPSEILYTYGKSARKAKLQYLGKSRVNGDSCFKVQFSNKYFLFVIPSGLSLKVVDSSGKYNTAFSWQYEGPIDGRGTHCDVCAEDDVDAMNILRLAYLK